MSQPTLMAEYAQQIRELICKVYKKQYVGRLDVLKDKDTYCVKIYHHQENPLCVTALLDWEDFLKFFEQELHDRHLIDVKYFTGYMTYAGLL